MPSFAVEVEGDASESIYKINRRLEVPDPLRNPFEGSIKEYGKGFYIVSMRPIYPDPTLFGVFFAFLAAALVLILGLGWWVFLPSLFFLGAGLLWSRRFFYFVFRLGLRKDGVKGRVTLLKSEEAFWRLSRWDK